MAINKAAFQADLLAQMASLIGVATGPTLAAREAFVQALAETVVDYHNSDGVSASLNFQDEGLDAGSPASASTINFVGDGVSVAVDGGVATVYITAGGVALPAVYTIGTRPAASSGIRGLRIIISDATYQGGADVEQTCLRGSGGVYSWVDTTLAAS